MGGCEWLAERRAMETRATPRQADELASFSTGRGDDATHTTFRGYEKTRRGFRRAFE